MDVGFVRCELKDVERLKLTSEGFEGGLVK
jgi:hypothetical protein